MKKIYLAGPLFSLAEREFNILFAQTIESRMKDVKVILPQERAAKFLSLENGMKLIFEDCLKMVCYHRKKTDPPATGFLTRP